MKRITIVISFVIIAFLFISCNSTRTNVPFLVYDMNDEYMSDLEEKIQSMSTTRFTIKTYDCQNSQIIQNEYLDEIFNQGYKVVIINPVDRLSVYPIIEKAKETNTKIIFINREPLTSDLNMSDNVYYVGANAVQSAKLQAGIIMDFFSFSKKFPTWLNDYDLNGDHAIQAVILKGQQGHQDAEERTKYVVDELEKQGFEVDLLDTVIANFDRQEAKSATQQIILDYGSQMEIIIANNDAMALGAIDALNDAGYFSDVNNDGIIERDSEPWFPVVGIDGLEEAIDSMNHGYLLGTVLNDSVNIAKATLELSQILLFDESFDQFDYKLTENKYVWIDYTKITGSVITETES